MSRQRQVLPGLFYRLPPAPDKLDPMALDGEGLRRALDNPTGREADKLLLDTFNGLSPLIARELAFRGGGDGEPLARELEKLLDAVRREDFAPYLLVREGKGRTLRFCPSSSTGPRPRAAGRKAFRSFWTASTRSGSRWSGCASGGRIWSSR